MNKTTIINEALLSGVRNAMMEEQHRIPTNSGFCEELFQSMVEEYQEDERERQIRDKENR